MLDAAREAVRNRLIHAYFDIDLQRIADTLEADLPELIAMLEVVLATAGDAAS
jgi:uncharacterized protein with HEPN domain